MAWPQNGHKHKLTTMRLFPGWEPSILFPSWEHGLRIIAPRTLRDFWESGYADSEQALRAWLAEVRVADWRSMADIRERYPSASIIDNERVVFNIRGNNYRLVVKIWFPGKLVFIKFIGTHADYDHLDVTQV